MGIHLRFQALLLEIAQKENDTSETLRLARMLFIRTGEFAYFDLLKKIIPAGEWDVALRQMIPELKGRYFDHIIPEIYLREEKWTDLLAAIQESHPSTAEHYRKQLEPRFPAEMCDLYERFALDTLAQKANRQGYQVACQFLRRIAKLGQRERVDNLVEDLRKKYSNRPALLDELKKV
jgi:uncharacterized Zn finger protein